MKTWIQGFGLLACIFAIFLTDTVSATETSRPRRDPDCVTRLVSGLLNSSSLWNPFLADVDPVYISSLKDLSRSKDSAFFKNTTLQGYDFSVSPGLIIDDTGFLPSYRWATPTARKVGWDGSEISVTREISEDELNSIRSMTRQAVIDGYDGAVQPEIVHVASKVEDGLDLKSISFAVARESPGGRIIGAARVANAYIENDKVILPSLEIMRRRQMISPSDETAIRDIVYDIKSRAIGGKFLPAEEIGQFYIDKKLSPRQRDAVRAQLLYWVMARHLSPEDHRTLVIAHTSDSAHDRLWGGIYGLNRPIIEKTKGEITEKVKFTTASELYLRLKKILKIP